MSDIVERPITHDEALESARRYIRQQFKNEGERPRASIPADPSRDDDLILTAYIEQQRKAESALAEKAKELERMREALRKAQHEAALTVSALAMMGASCCNADNALDILAATLTQETADNG